MAEYIEKKNLIEFACRHIDGKVDANDIARFPTADVVPVVRCKDCLYSKSYKTISENEGYYCQNPKCTFAYGTNWERIFEPIKNADDYCSYGERRCE